MAPRYETSSRSVSLNGGGTTISRRSKPLKVEMGAAATSSLVTRRKRRSGIRWISWALVALGIIWVGAIGFLSYNNTNKGSSPARRALSTPDNANKPTYSNATLSAWDFSKDEQVVQVIQTRFMQFQPNLIALGEARLKIFETICLPSVQAQSSQKFVWIIRTDPDLNQTLRDSLVSMVRLYPNVVLVGSNANPEGFRSKISVADIFPTNVWSGSYELLRRYHDASQSRVLIESRLDADDGLHHGFAEYTQYMIAQDLRKSEWLVVCAYNYLEWHYANPFSKSMVDTDSGFVVGMKQEGCITPGLSFVYGLDVKRSDMPAGSHVTLHKTTPKCTNVITSNCIWQSVELIPGAIRARTPTSAGMQNVVTQKHGHGGRNFRYTPVESDADFQGEIWGGVEKTFGIVQDEVRDLRGYLERNLPEIVADNLEGQCTKGHSCKSSTKSVLQQLLKSRRR